MRAFFVRAFRTLLGIALFFAGYGLTCLGIRHFLPTDRVPIVSVKMDYWSQHADDFDVAFFGSSRTFRQIVPEIFEKDLAAAGMKVKVFNLGIDGMRPPEDTFYMEQAFSYRKTPIKIVIVECNPIRLVTRDEDKGTVRSVYWHDWPRLVSIFHKAFFFDNKKRKLGDRIRKVWFAWGPFQEHLEYWLWNNANAGRGHDALFKLLNVDQLPPFSKSDLGRRVDGYKPPADVELMDEQKTKFYNAKKAEVLAKPPKPDPGDLASLAEIRKKNRLVEKAGGKMFLVVPPVLSENNIALTEGNGIPPVFDFSDQQKYPELFDPLHRSDTGHTNYAGAVIYTHLIVQKMLPLLKPNSP